MVLIYDFIFLILALIYLPIYIFKNKFHSGFISRLGILTKNLNLGRPIWIHAVSVGEAFSIKGLYGELKRAYPDRKFVVSTVTATGNKIVRGFIEKEDYVTYLPLDFSFIVRKVVSRIDPALFIIAETEIWPNLIRCLFQKKIPIIVVNARISDKSFRGYSNIKFLIKPILNKISLFCCQSNADLQRLSNLGVLSPKLKTTGNMKFDAADFGTLNSSARTTTLKKDLGLSLEDKLFVAGSTHPKEEEVILNAYRDVFKKSPYLKLLIAPRHPDRAKEIEGIVSRFGFRSVFISSLPVKPCACLTEPVFILDSIGRLTDFYSLAEIVFIGGSLIKKGGHNILEPAYFGKPIIFGPYMFNFKDIAELFLKKQAAVVVRDSDELAHSLKGLLNDSDKAIQLGGLAKGLIMAHQGATARNLQEIKPYL